MRLTGSQSRILYEALLTAFPSIPLLQKMVSFGLNVNLTVIANTETLSTAVFDLISWADTENKIDDLLKAAQANNPDLIELQSLPARLVQLPTISKAPAPPAPPAQTVPQENWYKELRAAAAERAWDRILKLARYIDPGSPADVVSWIGEAWRNIPCEMKVFTRHTAPVRSLVITPDGTQVLSGDENGSLHLWDLATMTIQRTMTVPAEANWVQESLTSRSVLALAVTVDGYRLLSGCGRRLVLWDLVAGEVLHIFEGHSDQVTLVAVSVDSALAITGSADQSLKVWDLVGGKEVRSIVRLLDRAVVSSLNHGGLGLAGFIITPWLTIPGMLLSGPAKQAMQKLGLLGVRGALHPAGDHAIAVFIDGKACVIDLASGEFFRVFDGHKGRIQSVILTTDGQYVVTGATDKTIKLWEWVTGQVISTLFGHTATVSALALAPDGSHLLSGSEDWTLKLWNLNGGIELRTFTGHTEPITAVAVTPDGMRLVSASEDQTVRIWTFPAGLLRPRR